MRRRVLIIALLIDGLLAGAAAVWYFGVRVRTASSADIATAAALAPAVEKLGFRVLRAEGAAKPKTNVFVSPSSLLQSLSMAVNGARGATRDAMLGAIAVDGMANARLNGLNAALLRSLRMPGPGVECDVANSMWLQTGDALAPGFETRVRQAFDAPVTVLDLAAPASVDRINAWARDATHGRIDGLLTRMPPNATLALLNATWMKGTWENTFDKARTHPGPFTHIDGSVLSLPMMQTTDPIDIVREKGLSMARLPYKGERFACYVALPERGHDPAEAARALQKEGFASMVARMAPSKVGLKLPRFTVEWADDLNDTLTKLGMGVAFKEGADFGDMRPGAWIGLVRQKTHLLVNEEGAEAAAATATAVAGAVASSRPDVEPFIVDRPFFCAIRDERTGVLLFVGLVYDPSNAPAAAQRDGSAGASPDHQVTARVQPTVMALR